MNIISAQQQPSSPSQIHQDSSSSSEQAHLSLISKKVNHFLKKKSSYSVSQIESILGHSTTQILKIIELVVIECENCAEMGCFLKREKVRLEGQKKELQNQLQEARRWMRQLRHENQDQLESLHFLRRKLENPRSTKVKEFDGINEDINEILRGQQQGISPKEKDKLEEVERELRVVLSSEEIHQSNQKLGLGIKLPERELQRRKKNSNLQDLSARISELSSLMIPMFERMAKFVNLIGGFILPDLQELAVLRKGYLNFKFGDFLQEKEFYELTKEFNKKYEEELELVRGFREIDTEMND